MENPEEREYRSVPELAADEAVIREALQMLHELDDTPPQQMTALFYQHWFEQLSMTPATFSASLAMTLTLKARQRSIPPALQEQSRPRRSPSDLR